MLPSLLPIARSFIRGLAALSLLATAAAPPAQAGEARYQSKRRGLAEAVEKRGSKKGLDATDWSAFQLAPSLPSPMTARPVTKLTYVATDDKDLDPEAKQMIERLMKVQQSGAHSVVFHDALGPGNSRLYLLDKEARGADGKAPSSPLAPGVDEVSSNDPRVLAKVIDWTFSKYPARRRYLQFMSHGGGPYGTGTDATLADPQGKITPNGPMPMSLPDFAGALRAGLKGRQLEGIYFLACLMGNVEAMLEIDDLASWAFVSEHPIYISQGSSIDMPALFEQLLASKVDGRELQRRLASSAHAKKQGDTLGYYEAAVVSLSAMKDVRRAVDGLARVLIEQLAVNPGPVVEAYDATPFVNEIGLRDLSVFAENVGKRVKKAKAAAAEVQVALSRALFYERTADASKARGLSIFMPPRAAGFGAFIPTFFLATGYQKTKLAQQTRWNEMLSAMRAVKVANAAAVTK